MNFDDLTWKCHVCGDERPDAAISICKVPFEIAGIPSTQNIRYCNDRADCSSKAPSISLFKAEPSEADISGSHS